MITANRSVRISLAFAAAVAIGLLLASPTVPAYAHGESIDVTPSEARPGESVTITGAEFPLGEEVELSLESARGSVSLGHAEVGDDEAFSVTVAIPESVSPGSYQLVAATGDDNVTVDFTALEGSAESSPSGGTTLVFQRSGGETIAIGLITAALVLGGAFLVVAGTRSHA